MGVAVAGIITVPYRIVPERMLPMTASHALSTVFRIFALRTELLNADEIRYVQCGFFRVLRILRSLKIVKYLQHLIAVGGQLVLQRSHVTQVACFSVPATVLIVSFITFVVFRFTSVPHVAQLRLRSHTDFLFAVLCLWLAKHVRLLKCILQTSHGKRTSKNAQRELVVQKLHVWSKTPTTLFTRPTDVPFCHSARYVCDDMIMSFDIVVE